MMLLYSVDLLTHFPGSSAPSGLYSPIESLRSRRLRDQIRLSYGTGAESDSVESDRIVRFKLLKYSDNFKIRFG